MILYAERFPEALRLGLRSCTILWRWYISGVLTQKWFLRTCGASIWIGHMNTLIKIEKSCVISITRASRLRQSLGWVCAKRHKSVGANYTQDNPSILSFCLWIGTSKSDGLCALHPNSILIISRLPGASLSHIINWPNNCTYCKGFEYV